MAQGEFAQDAEWTCACGRRYWIALATSPPSDPPAKAVLPFHRATDLSDFQLLVLESIAEGRTDREIARDLTISVNRVRYTVRDTIARLGARTRAEAVYLAMVSGTLAANSNHTFHEIQALPLHA